jgi:hypothetical protein
MAGTDEQRAGARHYETFVLRLWVEDDGEIQHGEIRHVRSNAAKRFRKIDHALAFIRGLVRPGEQDDAVNSALTRRW